VTAIPFMTPQNGGGVTDGPDGNECTRFGSVVIGSIGFAMDGAGPAAATPMSRWRSESDM
jgi:hypothetical protein